ncbi:hypothetical protein RvY_08775 [Ramazzottius varieornatus]|uniref:Cytochrome c oxidase assembly protein COX20, mitochondrial n=1 Tax=Ramazzottius varieornatus TaxID=947166 RepID=A0A1D1V715_RAMVA|nr:hypothetical protein RvY_08775 [Ramazzottius varieornatus]
MAASPNLDVEQALLDFEEAQEKKKSSLKLFGKSISDIPCFREAFLYGIVGGLGVGIASFLFTSRVGRSLDFTVYSYAAITAGTWCYCRYEKAHRHLELLRFKHEMKTRALTEGVTDTDRLRSVQTDSTSEEGSVIILPAPRTTS